MRRPAGQYYVLAFTSLSCATLIFMVQYLSINAISFHDRDGNQSLAQREEYWKFAM